MHRAVVQRLSACIATTLPSGTIGQIEHAFFVTHAATKAGAEYSAVTKVLADLGIDFVCWSGQYSSDNHLEVKPAIP